MNEWFAGRTKKKKVTVVSTMKRPVPLEHYILAKVNNKQQHQNEHKSPLYR